MKKLSVAVLIFFITFSLSASTARRGKVGIGNDFFSFGFSRNDDDQLSFSEEFSYESEDRWAISLDIDSVTNRGWKEDWSVSNEKKKSDSTELTTGRYDEISIYGSYNFLFDFNNKFTLEFQPQIGLAFFGDLNMDFFQNWLHEIRGIHSVQLPYDFKKLQVGSTAGGRLELFYNIYDFEHHSLMASAISDFEFIPNFSGDEYFALGFAIRRGNLNPVSFDFGYSLNQSFSESSTQKLYADHLRGYRFGFGVDTGFISVKYFTSPESGYGYGRIALDVLSLTRDTIFKKTDFKMGFGVKIVFLNTYTVLGFEYPVNDMWSITFTDSSVSGQPVDRKKEIEDDFSKDPRVKKNNTLMTIGMRRKFILPDETGKWVTPYAECTAGVARWSRVKLYNMIASSEIQSDTDVDYLSFITELIGGVTLFPEGLLVTDFSTVQMEFFGGASYIPVINSNYPKENNTHFSPLLGFCVTVGVDL